MPSRKTPVENLAFHLGTNLFINNQIAKKPFFITLSSGNKGVYMPIKQAPFSLKGAYDHLPGGEDA